MVSVLTGSNFCLGRNIQGSNSCMVWKGWTRWTPASCKCSLYMRSIDRRCWLIRGFVWATASWKRSALIAPSFWRSLRKFLVKDCTSTGYLLGTGGQRKPKNKTKQNTVFLNYFCEFVSDKLYFTVNLNKLEAFFIARSFFTQSLNLIFLIRQGLEDGVLCFGTINTL